MTRYRTIVFDLDGTLIDSYGALAESVNHVRTRHGHSPISEADVRRYVGEGVERLLEKIFSPRDVPEGAHEQFRAHYEEICCDGSVVLDDVEATLETLRSLDVAMTVCTNKPTAFSQKILDHLGLARLFAAVVGPDLAGCRKPDGRHIIAAMDAAGGAPASTLVVGDMTIDIAAARDASLPVAVIATGSCTREELTAAKPDHMLERLSDLVEIVRGEDA